MADDVNKTIMSIIDNAYVNTDHQLFGEFNDYEIEIERESEKDNWYLQVRVIGEGYLYDGWWPDSDGKSKERAICEALFGSQILNI